MTIIVALKVATGLVVAADSRLTVRQNGEVVFLSDANIKLFGRDGWPFSILTCGENLLAGRTVASWIDDLLSREIPRSSTIAAVVDALAEKLPPPGTGSVTYLIAGFDAAADRGADARIFKLNRFASGETNRYDQSQSDIFWDGEFEAITRLLIGRAPIYTEAVTSSPVHGQGEALVPYNAFNLQEGVDYVDFLIKTQIHFQRFVSTPQTCGGPVDIAAITPAGGFRWVRRKAFPPPIELG